VVSGKIGYEHLQTGISSISSAQDPISAASQYRSMEWS
jgi:hypothetical protein